MAGTSHPNDSLLSGEAAPPALPASFYPTEQQAFQPSAPASGFQELIDRAPLAMAVCDRELRYLAVNRRWKREFGLEDRILIGQKHSDLFPYLGIHWEKAVRSVLLGHPEECPRDQWVQPSHHPAWVRWHLEPWTSKRETIGGFTITCEVLGPPPPPAPAVHPLSARSADQMVECAAIGLALLDAAGRPVFANPEHASLLGFDLRSHPTLDAWLRSACPPGLNADELVENWRQSVWQDEATRTFALRSSDHRLRQIRFHPRRTSDGGLLLAMSDVTEFQQRLDDLQDAEVHFRALFEHAQVGLAVEDACSGQIVYANQACAALAQRSPDRLRQMNFLDLIQPEDHAAVQDRIAGVRREWASQTPSLDVRLVPESGQEKPSGEAKDAFVRLTLCGIPDAGGKLRQLAYFLTDIAIERLRSAPGPAAGQEDPVALAALRRQALAFEQAEEAILITDPSGQILDWNPAATRLFGYSREAVLGRSFSSLFAPRQPQPFHQAVAAAFASEGSWTGTQRFIRADGREGSCQVRYVAAQAPSSQASFIIGYHRLAGESTRGASAPGSRDRQTPGQKLE